MICESSIKDSIIDKPNSEDSWTLLISDI